MRKITNKLKYTLITVLLLVITSFFYVQNDHRKRKNTDLQNNEKVEKNINAVNISKVCFENNCFEVEIADTLEKHAQGLMNRERLNSESGMLFIFDTESKRSFWMKNTLIPLDIIWIDENKKVVFIKHNAEPCKTEKCKTFGPNKNAKYVLEINGGLAEEIGLTEEDVLEFR